MGNFTNFTCCNRLHFNHFSELFEFLDNENIELDNMIFEVSKQIQLKNSISKSSYLLELDYSIKNLKMELFDLYTFLDRVQREKPEHVKEKIFTNVQKEVLAYYLSVKNDINLLVSILFNFLEYKRIYYNN